MFCFLVKTYGCKYGYASYKTFLSEFHKIKWESRREIWPESFFDYTTSSKIHASIIQFNGKGMIIYLWDWWRVLLFLRKNRIKVENNNYCKNLWK